MKLLVLLFSISLIALASARAADVLYIGDSHSYGCFGETLDKSMRAMKTSTGRAITVRSGATCGSSTASWLAAKGHETACGYRACTVNNTCTKSTKGHSDSAEKLMQEESPKVTVVALGSNMLKRSPLAAMTDVHILIGKIKTQHSECVWIGPPQPALFFQRAEAYQAFNERLRSTVEGGGCRFILSDDKTSRENLRDSMGLHYDCANGTRWAEKVMKELRPLLQSGTAPSAPIVGGRSATSATKP